MELKAGLSRYLDNIKSEFSEIRKDRIETLLLIGQYIEESLKKSGAADLVFICTHNSRRSQFGQVWANTASRYYELEGLRSFSGGTEETEFNSRAVDAILRSGFDVQQSPGNEGNPRYLVQSGINIRGEVMFSKKYEDPPNPSKNFCAIMVCSDADEACPIIPGAAKRISLPYEDPKSFDGTLQEIQKYDERCREIARDIFFLFRSISSTQGDSNHLIQ